MEDFYSFEMRRSEEDLMDQSEIEKNCSNIDGGVDASSEDIVINYVGNHTISPSLNNENRTEIVAEAAIVADNSTSSATIEPDAKCNPSDDSEEVDEVFSEQCGQTCDNPVPTVVDHESFKSLEEAKTAKEEGNTYFRSQNFEEALNSYTIAIETCPLTDVNDMAIFFGNRAACYFAIKEYELCVEDCDDALKYNSKYVKVLIRRSMAFEHLDRLEEAITDLKTVQEIDSDYKVQNAIDRLTKLNNEKMEKMKEEAMGKLKDLGNSVLGFMGMSLDDFKFTQDANTGSWSISTNPGGNAQK